MTAMNKYDLTQTHITHFDATTTPIALSTTAVNVDYGGKKRACFAASLQFPKNKITALIGASGSGKYTYLRCLNRMNDAVATVSGKINYAGLNLNAPEINVYQVRKHIGMVFQRPNPFAKSIYANMTLALREHGITAKAELQRRTEECLRAVALWDEVKDDLNKSALALSGGQQQRLCIARTLAMQPDIILLDEPTNALDPVSTNKVEETLLTLKQHYTLIIVTHNMQQAARISDYTAFFHQGHVMEYDKTKTIFTNPTLAITNDYVSGSFG